MRSTGGSVGIKTPMLLKLIFKSINRLAKYLNKRDKANYKEVKPKVLLLQK